MNMNSTGCYLHGETESQVLYIKLPHQYERAIENIALEKPFHMHF